jgi:hypothetical protein
MAGEMKERGLDRLDDHDHDDDDIVRFSSGSARFGSVRFGLGNVERRFSFLWAGDWSWRAFFVSCVVIMVLVLVAEYLPVCSCHSRFLLFIIRSVCFQVFDKLEVRFVTTAAITAQASQRGFF